MLKFLSGLILLQVITISLFLLAPVDIDGLAWLRVGVPMFIAALLIAFWFNAMAIQMRSDEINKLKEKHFIEREKIKINAERAKQRVTQSAQKQIEKEIWRTSARANVKVGAAIAGTAAIGGLLLLTQFMTLGIMTLTTAGGVMGGYFIRYRQEKRRAIEQSAPNIINNLPTKSTTTEKLTQQN